MADRVKVTMDRGVAEVRLNRPDKMNAIDGGMFEALIEAGEKLRRDESVRAVVMSGEEVVGSMLTLSGRTAWATAVPAAAALVATAGIAVA